jgi:NAD-dependent dihydropyrimidine dehydrogenase PreA subunit
MTYVITQSCVDHMDQSCVAVCPVDCIGSEPGVDRKFFIDPDGCIECGSCLAVCPNDAIYAAEDLPASLATFAWIDAAWHRDRSVARAVLEEVLSGAAA